MSGRDPQISFRPLAADDELFLVHLYARTHGRQLAQASDDPQMQLLLKMQCESQQRQYAACENADLQIVLLNGEPVGRWYVQRKPEEFHIIDIALLPGSLPGLGRTIVRGFLLEAADRNVCVHAHVEKANRAWLLWKRMGFRIVGDTGMYHEILWCPD